MNRRKFLKVAAGAVVGVAVAPIAAKVISDIPKPVESLSREYKARMVVSEDGSGSEIEWSFAAEPPGVTYSHSDFYFGSLPVVTHTRIKDTAKTVLIS